MKFLEKDLEQIIMETPNKMLQDRGLCIWGEKRNQVRVGNYGVLDVIALDRGNNEYKEPPTITLFELKKDKIGVGAFFQSINYIKGIQEYFIKRNIDIDKFLWNITLIGKELDTSGSFCYLPELIANSSMTPSRYLNSLEFYTYSYEIDGLIFKDHLGYTLNNKGF